MIYIQDWALQFYLYLYVGDSGAQSILHPGHQVVGLLLRQTLRGYGGGEGIHRGQDYSRDSATLLSFNWRDERGADPACCPQTSPPCSGPQRCRSRLRSSFSCQTRGGGAGSARQTARSRRAPAHTGKARKISTAVFLHIYKFLKSAFQGHFISVLSSFIWRGQLLLLAWDPQAN